MDQTRHLRIHGRVQGVCYRAWAVETAEALRLDGWVRNRTDGTVEMLVHGTRTAVERMIERAWQGPPAARVERIEADEAEQPVPAGFSTKPTV